MSSLRFALFGAGFWSRYQLAGWGEVEGAECVAVCDPGRSKGEALAAEFGIRAVYVDAAELLANESLDFVDIVTDVDSHAPLAMLGAQHELAVICQKPMAPSLLLAGEMVATARSKQTPLLVHENWRWQRPMRKLRSILESGCLGEVVRARIDFANSFPVFENQPALKQLPKFMLTDVGTHLLDATRFLFGEVTELYCQTRQIRQDIAGEDVATVVMRMTSGATVTCNMSYASRWEFDRFPESFVAVEGTMGGVSLGADCEIKVFDERGIYTESARPTHYDWSDPAYALVHSSIVDCQRHLIGALRGEWPAETTGEDNLRTLELVYGAYESAAESRVIKFSNPLEKS